MHLVRRHERARVTESRRPGEAPQVLVDGGGIVADTATQVQRLVGPARDAAGAQREAMHDAFGGQQARSEEKALVHSSIVMDQRRLELVTEFRSVAAAGLLRDAIERLLSAAWPAQKDDALGDAMLDLRARAARRELDRLAQATPRRRVLALSVYRPDSGQIQAAVAEVKRTRHDLRLALGSTAILTGGKFQNLNVLLADFAPPDWLVVADDDIALPDGFLDCLIALCEALALDLAQPAQTLASHAAWRFARRRPLSVARERMDSTWYCPAASSGRSDAPAPAPWAQATPPSDAATRPATLHALAMAVPVSDRCSRCCGRTVHVCTRLASVRGAR